MSIVIRNRYIHRIITEIIMLCERTLTMQSFCSPHPALQCIYLKNQILVLTHQFLFIGNLKNILLLFRSPHPQQIIQVLIPVKPDSFLGCVLVH